VPKPRTAGADSVRDSFPGAESHQGKGLGSILLANALQRIARASQVMAVYAVVIDALHVRPTAYYRQFGFIPRPSQPLKRCLPMNYVIHVVCHHDWPIDPRRAGTVNAGLAAHED
jgi:predicted N-acetyltransferase YhbS